MFTASINLHPSQVKIGLYVPHDPHIIQPIEWKNLVLNAAQVGAVEMRKELEKHGRDMRKKVSRGEHAWMLAQSRTSPGLMPGRPNTTF